MKVSHFRLHHQESLRVEKRKNNWILHSTVLIATVETTLSDTKLVGKPLSIPYFEFVTRLSVIYRVIMKSFLRHRVKDETALNTNTNHHIILTRTIIIIHYILQELRSQNACANQHHNLKKKHC